MVHKLQSVILRDSASLETAAKRTYFHCSRMENLTPDKKNDMKVYEGMKAYRCFSVTKLLFKFFKHFS